MGKPLSIKAVLLFILFNLLVNQGHADIVMQTGAKNFSNMIIGVVVAFFW
jgi:hypothetical protein